MFVEEKALGESQEPSLDGFIGFLENKNPTEKYTWTNSHECACAQYLKSIEKFSDKWLHGSSDSTMHKLNRIAGGDYLTTPYDGVPGLSVASWTFGGCLERAKKVKELA